MNYTRLILSAMILSMAAGCSVDERLVEPLSAQKDKELTIQAIREDGITDTKTSRDECDGSVWWTPGDALSLFYGSGSAGGSKFITTATESCRSADFSGTIGVITGGGEGTTIDDTFFWGLYPYQEDASCDGSSITMNLPSVQTAVPGTFATNLFPTLARSQGLIFRFYNICGGMMFSVTKEGLKKVTLKSNNGELITGKAKVGFNASSGLPEVKEIIDGSDEIVLEAPNGESFEVGKFYYMVMFPTTFSGGFSVKLETFTEEATVEKTNKLTAKRSVFGKISNIDGNATYSSKPLKKYLTFTSEGSTDISIQSEYDGFYYSYDKQTWTNWSGESITFSSTSPLYLCGDNPYDTEKGSLGQFQAEGDLFGISGNIMSLVNSDEDVLEVHKNQFNSLFASCTRLTSAPELPATTLAQGCYAFMFNGCTGLTAAPELPATTLANNCYQNMFSCCTSLTSTPQLPATTMEWSCYVYMFYNCTNLTSAPQLPALKLAPYCYQGMFRGCTSLISAPELPATTMSNTCYLDMFSDCTSLTSAPQLPALKLAPCCYASMFSGCTSLTSAPELPATTLDICCYEYMFYNCTNLTSAPELPATTMEYGCYSRMFSGCTGLTSAPQLPALKLAQSCYEDMFSGCTSLTYAPELPATTLELLCYRNMFSDCTNLIYIKCLAKNDVKDMVINWVSGVASSGVFVKAASMTDWPTGSSGIPEGWTVIDDNSI